MELSKLTLEQLICFYIYNSQEVKISYDRIGSRTIDEIKELEDNYPKLIKVTPCYIKINKEYYEEYIDKVISVNRTIPKDIFEEIIK